MNPSVKLKLNWDTDTMLHAGAAVADISPRGPVHLYGYPHVERTSTGIHDPLLFTAIVIKTGSAALVLGSLDLLMIEPAFARQLRRTAAEAAGCSEACAMISCTHTHSGPVSSELIGWAAAPAQARPDPAYLDYVKAQVRQAVSSAAAGAVPAEFAWTSASAAGVGGNRLTDNGVTDPECGILSFRSRQDHEILAMAVIYGMHPTVLHGDSTLVSADFPYYTRLHIQEHFTSTFPVSYHTAPCGNQSPRRFVAAQTFAEAERLGRKLGSAVTAAFDGIPSSAWQHTAELAGRIEKVQLPRNSIMPLDEAEALLNRYRNNYLFLRQQKAPRAEIRTAECAVFGAERTVALARARADGLIERKLADYEPAEIQLLRAGDIDIVGLPGECFTEYSLQIKSAAGRKTFVVSLVNGDLQGYIVTPEAVAAGGYEATNAVFAADSGRMLAEAALKIAENLVTR